MRKITAVLLLVALAAMPSLAGLKFVATPNQVAYVAPGTGNMALSVDLDAMAAGKVRFVTGPVGTSTPISFTFVPQAGASGSAPVINSTSTLGGWNPVTPAGPNTFTAFNFLTANLDSSNPSELVGDLNFTIPDATTNGLWDLVAEVPGWVLSDSDSATPDYAGVGMIGTIAVVGIPEPSSFLFLGLVGSGVAGLQVWRRRKNSGVEETSEPEEVA